MNRNDYVREWSVKTGRPESEIYVPEHLALEDSVRKLIDVIREDGSTSGTWPLPVAKRPQKVGGIAYVSLARFQSYRGRTTAALVQEIVDLVEEDGWSGSIMYNVTADGLVRLEV